MTSYEWSDKGVNGVRDWKKVPVVVFNVQTKGLSDIALKVVDKELRKQISDIIRPVFLSIFPAPDDGKGEPEVNFSIKLNL